MKKIIVICLFSIVALAAAPEREVTRAIAAMSGQQASFVQRFTPLGFKNAQVESGLVVFGPSPQMRWTYSQPEAKTFVFDGTTSWFYVPSDRQVTVNQLTDEERRGLPFLLLGDPAAVTANYALKESNRRGVVTTSLAARDSRAMVREIVVTTSASDHRVSSLQYVDKQGNRTVFQFSNYKPASAAEAQFTFQPPPGVQVVRQ